MTVKQGLAPTALFLFDVSMIQFISLVRAIRGILALLCMASLSACAIVEPPQEESTLMRVGWIEKVVVMPGDMVLHAKLDTGADHPSLHATDIKKFRKNGSQWVRFTIENRRGRTKTLELPVERMARIKRVKGRTQERFVVRMQLCLGTSNIETEVNLVDRSNFSYPLLVGRGYLAGNAILDPSASYTVQPSCDTDGEE
jgi:hypothetical protein